MNTTQELTKESQEFLDNLITGIWYSCKRAGLNAAETDVVTSAVGEALHYGVTKEATSFAARHPALFRSLVGAGIGSIGAGVGTWLSNLGRKKEDRNSVLGAMAGGGVLGGLGGLGYHWLANRDLGTKADFKPVIHGTRIVPQYEAVPGKGEAPIPKVTPSHDLTAQYITESLRANRPQQPNPVITTPQTPVTSDILGTTPGYATAPLPQGGMPPADYYDKLFQNWQYRGDARGPVNPVG
jgi:hypothetical protein